MACYPRGRQNNHFFLDIYETFPMIIKEAFFQKRCLFFAQKKGLGVKLYRHFCLFLLLISFLIPLNVAYLYYDYYSGIELRVRKNFSSEDEESLLILFKKNPRIIYFPVASAQSHLLLLLEVSFFSPCGIILTPPTNLVLRCWHISLPYLYLDTSNLIFQILTLFEWLRGLFLLDIFPRGGKAHSFLGLFSIRENRPFWSIRRISLSSCQTLLHPVCLARRIGFTGFFLWIQEGNFHVNEETFCNFEVGLSWN